MTIASLAWVLWLLVGIWPKIDAHKTEIRFEPLLFGLLLSLVASYLAFVVFATFANLLRISTLSRRELAHLYYTSQMLKHIPGRVWGVGYQWAAGRSAGPLGNWVLVNVGHMLLATFFALWSSAVALGFSRSQLWGLLAAVGGGSGYIAAWSLISSRRLLGWVGLLRGRFGKLSSAVVDVFSSTPISVRVKIFLFFSFSWMFYYASWFMNGLAYPPLGAAGGVQLCAYYMLAWFVGYVSLLTPSGLGVRELVFVWLAKDFPGDAVALMAVVGRIGLLAVDLIMGLAFAPFAPRKS
ncbi:MAG: hypothetical protein ABI311_03135 [Gemmatimonadaceae bacterium]